MRIIAVLFALLLPFAASAQNPPAMNQGAMQNMMQAMQQVQECMAAIDQSKLEELQARSEKVQQEIKSLCTKGQRDKAQGTAMDFGRGLASDPTMQQMRKCGEMARGALPMMESMPTYDEKEYANRHVCDE